MDKKPTRCHFVLSFISPLQVAQHVSGNHVPIFRSWRLRSVISTCWYCAVTMSGIIQICLSVWVEVFYVWFMVNLVWAGCVWLCRVLWVVVSLYVGVVRCVSSILAKSLIISFQYNIESVHFFWVVTLYLIITPHLSTLSLFHFVLCDFLAIVVVWTSFLVIETSNREFILREIQRLNSYSAVSTIRIQYKNNQLMLCRQTIYVVAKLQNFQTLNLMVRKVTTGLQNVNHADCNYTGTSATGCVFLDNLITVSVTCECCRCYRKWFLLKHLYTIPPGKLSCQDFQNIRFYELI